MTEAPSAAALGDVSAEPEVHGPLDLVATLGPLYRGPRDPAMRLASRSVARAANTPDGPGALVLDLEPGPVGETSRVGARAWGVGATWLLDHAPAFLGLDDDPTGFEPALHPVIA